MIEVLYTPEFKRRYRELPSAIQRKAEQRETLFRENPFHPLLRTEKLRPHSKEYWSFRIDPHYRIVFRFKDASSRSVIFLTCGHHNWIYRYVVTH